jgi:hypothetical protein
MDQLVRAVQAISPEQNARRIIRSLTPDQLNQLRRVVPNGIQAVRDLASTLGLAWARQRADDSIEDTDMEGHIGHELDLIAQSNAARRLDFSSTNTMEGASETTNTLRIAGGDGGKKGSQETPITPQNPHYGLADTTTVILPYTQYLSVIPGTINDYTMVDFSLRLTSVTDILPTALTAPTPGATLSTGLYNHVAPTNAGTTWQSTLVEFPQTTTAGLPNNERPAWRTFWQKLYQYYTVLGCEYELTFVNSRNQINSNVVIAYGFDTYGASSSGNVFPTGKQMYQMEAWKGLNWKLLKSTGDSSGQGSTTTIKGYYKPNQAHRNVNNDEDVKTWTAVGSNPSLTETLRVFIGRGCFNDCPWNTINIRCKMRYIVQYKDPVENITWPYTGQTQVAMNVGNDILPTAA